MEFICLYDLMMYANTVHPCCKGHSLQANTEIAMSGTNDNPQVDPGLDDRVDDLDQEEVFRGDATGDSSRSGISQPYVFSIGLTLANTGSALLGSRLSYCMSINATTHLKPLSCLVCKCFRWCLG